MTGVGKRTFERPAGRFWEEEVHDGDYECIKGSEY